MGTLPLLDLKAVEARLAARRAEWEKYGAGNPSFAADDDCTALLAHARALRAVLRLGRDLLMEHAEHLGAAEEVFNDWDGQASAELRAAQDGPA